MVVVLIHLALSLPDQLQDPLVVQLVNNFRFFPITKLVPSHAHFPCSLLHAYPSQLVYPICALIQLSFDTPWEI
jgi:hypothetical protein